MSCQLQPENNPFLSFPPDSKLLGGWQSFIHSVSLVLGTVHTEQLMNVCWVNINNPITAAKEDAHHHVCLYPPTSFSSLMCTKNTQKDGRKFESWNAHLDLHRGTLTVLNYKGGVLAPVAAEHLLAAAQISSSVGQMKKTIRNTDTKPRGRKKDGVR